MLIPQASNTAGNVDAVFYRILSIELGLLIIVTFALIFFVVKYNSSKKTIPENIPGNVPLEIIWTAIPTVIVLVMFYMGLVSFDSIRTVPETAMDIRVTGRQWSWLFTYANGRQSTDLRVPVGKPVKLLLTSVDVLHSFYIPAFRIKEDCVPKMETYLSFTPDETGAFDIFCTEFCGLGHSGMVSKVVVMQEKDFDSWYAAAPAVSKDKGRQLLDEKGCLGCHSIDGTAKIGPTFKGLYESKATVLTNGRERTIEADEDYLRRAIKEPKADVVKGFPDIMPVLPVTPDELDQIIEFIETLK
jgi:cytochrome c oxidase subunit II